MSLSRLVFFLLLAACSSATSGVAPRPRRAPRGPIPPAELMQNVLAGTPASEEDPCVLGMVMAGVDDERAGQRMDQALLGLVARSTRSAREVVCTNVLAAARLLRLERMNRLDLRAELARPEPEVRVIALLQIVHKRDSSLLAQVREMVRDPQLPVASAAMRVLVALGDAGSIQTLRMLSINPDETRLHGAACRALWDMNVTDACGGRPQDDQAASLGASGSIVAAEDPCAVARRDLKASDPSRVQGALVQLLTSRFAPLSASLDPVRASCLNCAAPEACSIPTRTTRRIARSGPSWGSALASALLLLKDWPR